MACQGSVQWCAAACVSLPHAAPASAHAMRTAYACCMQERTTRVVILRSMVPKAFSAGADLKERATMTQARAGHKHKRCNRQCCLVVSAQ